MLGYINSKPAVFSEHAPGIWWLGLPKGLCPMDLDLMRAKQPDFQHTKQKQKFKGFYTHQSRFGPAYTAGQPKTNVVPFEINQIMFK